ncbi:hypothetical protein CEXT_613491 [Caerostris extrusa]|uniref:Uncharacterized protein n=1 Tax=Caerostris extrusa TaxID=172846 RepID=A0AAV4RAI8_CAEEX|nr:hypothetical protein CEXT_613491 [Caerostris extrusa]
MRHKRKRTPPPTSHRRKEEQNIFGEGKPLCQHRNRAFACHLQVQNRALAVFLFKNTSFFFLPFCLRASVVKFKSGDPRRGQGLEQRWKHLEIRLATVN